MSKADAPAFPMIEHLGEVHADNPKRTHYFNIKGGLTKRELFAAIAMQGAIATPANNGTPQDIARLSVIQADALLMELEGRNE